MSSLAILYPFRPTLSDGGFPSKPVVRAKNSNQSISEGGRIWQGSFCTKASPPKELVAIFDFPDVAIALAQTHQRLALGAASRSLHFSHAGKSWADIIVVIIIIIIISSSSSSNIMSYIAIITIITITVTIMQISIMTIVVAIITVVIDFCESNDLWHGRRQADRCCDPLALTASSDST